MGIYIHGQVREIKKEKEINRRPLTHSSNSSYKIALSFIHTHTHTHTRYLHRVRACTIFICPYVAHKYHTCTHNISLSLSLLSSIIFAHLSLV